jgi:drug/metabolite transporter (DMT)-like permease
MIRETKGTAIASLILCALLWSLAGVLIKLVNWDAFAIAGIRSLLGFFTMLVFIRRPVFSFSLNQVMAAVSYSATMILFVYANKMTTAANAIVLQYTEPVYLILLAKFLLGGEKTDPVDWIAIVGVLGGMVLFFLDDLDFRANTGNLLAILSGVTFALTTIFLRRQKDGRQADSFMLAHLLTFALSLPFILRSGIPSPVSMGGLALLGVFQIGFPALLFSRGVRGVTALSASIISMIEPVLNPVWVAVFLGELPSCRAVLGGCIIILCVTVRTVLKVRKI